MFNGVNSAENASRPTPSSLRNTERLSPENVVSLDQFRINNSRTAYRGVFRAAYIPFPLFSSIGVARPVSRISLSLPLSAATRERTFFFFFFFLVVYDEGEGETKGSGGNSVVPWPSSSQTNGIGTNEAGSPLIPKREMRMEVVREIIPYTHVPCGVSMRKIDFFKAPRPQFLTRFLIGNDIPRRASPSGRGRARGNNTQDRFSSCFFPSVFHPPIRVNNDTRASDHIKFSYFFYQCFVRGILIIVEDLSKRNRML